jgi:hypothetical protein
MLQFYVLNFVASLKKKTKGRVFQVAKQLKTRQLQLNPGRLACFTMAFQLQVLTGPTTMW